jgi:hypothetical protein
MGSSQPSSECLSIVRGGTPGKRPVIALLTLPFLLVSSIAVAEGIPAPLFSFWEITGAELELRFRADAGFDYTVERKERVNEAWAHSASYPSGDLVTTNTYRTGSINRQTELFRLTRTITDFSFVHYSSPNISNILGHVFSEQSVKEAITTINTFGLGDVTSDIPEWRIGDFTAFFPQGMVVDFQRAVDGSPTGYGSTAAQMQGTTSAFHINSFTAPDGGSPHKAAQVNYAWPTTEDSAVHPWTASTYGDTATLYFDFEAAVPSSWTGGGSINYAGPVTLFTNADDGTQLKLTMGLYDHRGESQFVEQVQWDEPTKTATVFSHYGATRYTTTPPGSAGTTDQTWSEWRLFSHSINREQLQIAITDLNELFESGLSTNPDDYQLSVFGVGPEMFVQNGTVGNMAMKVRNVRTYTRRN